MEDTHRRNEANMRRKQINPQLANGNLIPEAPPSPASTGAMDSLLEKLRAAAPQTRDTRDRRRRARLKDRHQVRVASGQQMPEIDGIGEVIDENALLSPTRTEGSEDTGPENGATSEGEDIAERAASMLQGLRGDNTEGDSVARDDIIRVRRRRESADGERQRRRQRRTGVSSIDTATQSTIIEEPSQTETGEVSEEREPDRDTQQPSPPTTVVVPPSPTESEKGAFASAANQERVL